MDYDLAPSTLAYASVSTGYKQGGVQPSAPALFGKTFAPETVTNYEAGIKTRISNGPSIRLAGYYTDYKNLQVFQYISIGNTSISVTTNAGAARIYGAELEAEWALTALDHLSGFLTYTHARYTRFDNAIDSRTATVIGSLKGNQLPNAPDVTARIQYSHDFELPGGGKVTPQATFYYQSRSYTQSINDGGYRIRPYTKTDLSLTYANESDDFTLSAYVMNVENHIVKSSDFSGPNIVYSDFQPPRTWGVRASYKF